MDITSILEKTGIDALLITNPYNMRYLSGFRGGEGVLYMSRNSQVLITDSRYTEAAARESSFTIEESRSGHGITDILKEYIQREDVKGLGYEDESMVCKTFWNYQAALSMVKEWIPVGGAVSRLRQIKTDKEIGYLRQAEAIGDQVFSKMLTLIRPGMTEQELQAELEYQMMKCGASGTSFDTIVASGIHSSMPHAIPSDKKIEPGDFLTMDFGCRYQGYCSDMTRTVVIGRASEKQKEIYQLVLKANLVAESFLKAGRICREVDKIARDIITDGGYGDCFGHGLGHSVGLEIHESPACNTRDTTVLKPNMIMTIEPGIYVPGFGGVRIEDMVVITPDGFENLAHSTKELIEL
ncbi:MAG: Xaa-Pro peptidase family protein [Bacteroides sp.]|nr:Xaa-Pro peptidase family protein [Bacteroides sp.]MCM1549864.1 Xaa-Pro peptidase family protein [Clostridium sp.]